MFEEEIEQRLMAVARVSGDVVQRTGTRPGPGGSKRGDLTIDLAGGVGRIVIEVKSGAIASPPKLIGELEGATATRDADLAIAVVRNADDIPIQARPFQFYATSCRRCSATCSAGSSSSPCSRTCRRTRSNKTRAAPKISDGATARRCRSLRFSRVVRRCRGGAPRPAPPARRL